MRATGDGIELVGGQGVALGIVPDAEYAEGRLPLQQGDQLVLFTDGLVEVAGNDPMDHLEAVQKLISGCRSSAPQRLVEQLYHDALRRSGGVLRDDVALVALQCDRVPRSGSSRSSASAAASA